MVVVAFYLSVQSNPIQSNSIHESTLINTYYMYIYSRRLSFFLIILLPCFFIIYVCVCAIYLLNRPYPFLLSLSQVLPDGYLMTGEGQHCRAL
jgi:hypothetical protein